MEKGTIARLNHQGGYGFIAQEGKKENIFFHTSELRNVQFDELKEGDELTFDVSEGPKGPNATNVNRV